MRNKKYKKIVVDLSCTLIHHGHIRLLKKAKKYGKVFVALTSDEEIRKHKKIRSELNYLNRREILLSIKYVSGVIKCKYHITDSFLKKHNFDLLIHGHDNINPIKKKYLKIVGRTKKISSTILRKRAKKNIT